MKRKRWIVALALVLSLVGWLLLQTAPVADEVGVNHGPPGVAARTERAHGDTYGTQQQFFYATATAEALWRAAQNAP